MEVVDATEGRIAEMIAGIKPGSVVVAVLAAAVVAGVVTACVDTTGAGLGTLGFGSKKNQKDHGIKPKLYIFERERKTDVPTGGTSANGPALPRWKPLLRCSADCLSRRVIVRQVM